MQHYVTPFLKWRPKKIWRVFYLVMFSLWIKWFFTLVLTLQQMNSMNVKRLCVPSDLWKKNHELLFFIRFQKCISAKSFANNFQEIYSLGCALGDVSSCVHRLLWNFRNVSNATTLWQIQKWLLIKAVIKIDSKYSFRIRPELYV